MALIRRRRQKSPPHQHDDLEEELNPDEIERPEMVIHGITNANNEQVMLILQQAGKPN